MSPDLGMVTGHKHASSAILGDNIRVLVQFTVYVQQYTRTTSLCKRCIDIYSSMTEANFSVSFCNNCSYCAYD